MSTETQAVYDVDELVSVELTEEEALTQLHSQHLTTDASLFGTVTPAEVVWPTHQHVLDQEAIIKGEQ